MNAPHATAFLRIRDDGRGPIAFAAVAVFDGHKRIKQTTKTIGPVHVQPVPGAKGAAAWKPVRGRPPEGVLTRDQAATRMGELRDAILAEATQAPVQGHPFADACDAWLADCERQHCSPATMRDYRSSVRRHMRGAFDKDCSAVTVQDVRDLRARLEATGLSARTVKKVLTVLHGILAFAGVEPNPVKEAAPKERRTKRRRQARAEQDGAPRYFTWAEVAALVAAAGTEQDRAMILVSARTGLRLGEVLALRYGHIEDEWLHVQRSYDKDGTEDVPKSGKARRTPLDPQAARVMADLRDGAGDDALVFGNEAGEHQHPDAVGHRFLRLQRRVGIYQEDRGFHCLRHSFGTYAAELYPLPNVQAWLGHEDIQTTMRYVHAVPQEDAPRRLGEHWPAVLAPGLEAA
jgi:integrase